MTQLLKLLSQEPSLASLELRPEVQETLLVVRRGDRELRFHAAALDRGLGDLLVDLVAELLDHTELAVRFAGLARGAELSPELGSALADLARATTAEAVSSTVLGAALAGAGGFERGAVFLLDRASGAYVCAGARERDDVEPPPSTVGVASRRVGAGRGSPFVEAAKALELRPRPGDDEVSAATRGRGGAFDRDAQGDDPLSPLAPKRRFALLSAGARTPPAALLFGDGEDDALAEPRLELLRSLLGHAELAWECVRLRREVDDLQRTDADSGLHNRREFELRLSQERSRAQRSKAGLSLLLLGAAPDAEASFAPADARALASVLRDELRAVDIAARFDPSALVVLLPGAGTLEAALVARRVGVAAHRRGLAPCVGLASYPDDCDHPDDLVGLAQVTLAAARAAGPGRASLSGDDPPIVFAEEADEA